jgi:fumarate reductase subunit C
MSENKKPKNSNVPERKGGFNKAHTKKIIKIFITFFIFFFIVWLIIGSSIHPNNKATYYSTLASRAAWIFGTVIAVMMLIVAVINALISLNKFDKIFLERDLTRNPLCVILLCIIAISLSALFTVVLYGVNSIYSSIRMKEEPEITYPSVLEEVKKNKDELQPSSFKNDVNINVFIEDSTPLEIIEDESYSTTKPLIEILFPNIQIWVKYPITTRNADFRIPLSFEEADEHLSELRDFNLSVAPHESVLNDRVYLESMSAFNGYNQNAKAAINNNRPANEIIEQYELSLSELANANEATIRMGGYRHEVLAPIGRIAFELGVFYKINGYYDEAVYCFAVAIHHMLHALRISEEYGWEKTIIDYKMPYMLANMYNHFSNMSSHDYLAKLETLSIADYWSEYNILIGGSVFDSNLLRTEINIKLAYLSSDMEIKAHYLIQAEISLSICLQFPDELNYITKKGLFNIRREEVYNFTSAFWERYSDGIDGMLTAEELNAKYY